MGNLVRRKILSTSCISFQAILLRANKTHAVPLDCRNRKFAVSYHVEGSELGKRRYHVDQFEVSKRATKVCFHI